MSGRNRQKMVLLSDDTFKIASNMDNFSGWLRARLRQFDEGLDLVEMDLMKQHLKKKFDTLNLAMAQELEGPVYDAVWVKYNIIMKQSKLGDFE